MDTETAEVVDRINARIDALEVTLRGEIRDSLVEAKRHTEFVVADVRSELREEIRNSLAESKRHAVILNEDVRDDIRMLAENFAVMSVKLDSLQR